MTRPRDKRKRENSLPSPPTSSLQRAGQLDRWALGHVEICYILLREWVHSATLCSPPNKGHKEHLPETSPAVLTNAGCGKEGVRPLQLCGPQARLCGRWAGRERKEEAGSAASQGGPRLCQAALWVHQFEQKSGWTHTLSWSGANSAPGRRMGPGGRGG